MRKRDRRTSRPRRTLTVDLGEQLWLALEQCVEDINTDAWAEYRRSYGHTATRADVIRFALKALTWHLRGESHPFERAAGMEGSELA